MMAWFPHFYAPRKRAATIHAVYVADGVADDCEELIHRCCQVGTLNFNVFSNIWKDMNFAWIFQGRNSAPELAELSEEAIHVAKRYLLQNTLNFEETVASLFLIYALLHLQPIEGFASLRLTPEDLDAITRIQVMARQQHRHDVLYILGSVLVKGPCQFHVGEREYGMDTAVKKYYDSITSIDKYGIRPKGVFYRQTEELDLLRELTSLSRRYARAKIFDNKVMPDRTLRYTDEHLPSELTASLKQLIEGDTTGSKAQATNVQAIKDRAMWHQIQEMRHLKSLPEKTSKREQKRDEGESSKTNLRNKNRKNSSELPRTKSGSPKKPLPTNTSKKKAANKPCKSKSVVTTSDDGSDDISLSSDDDDTENDTDNDIDEEEDAETHLNNLKTIDEYLNRIKDLPHTVTSENQPSTSTSESIQYEIEIIDYMQDDSNINSSEINLNENVDVPKSNQNKRRQSTRKSLENENIDEQTNLKEKVDAPKTNQNKRRQSNRKSSENKNIDDEPNLIEKVDVPKTYQNKRAPKNRRISENKSIDIVPNLNEKVDVPKPRRNKVGLNNRRISEKKYIDTVPNLNKKFEVPLDVTDITIDSIETELDKTDPKDNNTTPNEIEMVDATKSKQYSNRSKEAVATDSKKDNLETEMETEQIFTRVTRSRVAKKNIDKPSPPVEKRPKARAEAIKARAKAIKARAMAIKARTMAIKAIKRKLALLKDTSSIDLPPPMPTKSLTELFGDEIAEELIEDGNESRDSSAVKVAVVKRRYIRKAVKKIKGVSKRQKRKK